MLQLLVLYKDGIAGTKHYNRVGLMTKYHILSNKVNNCKLIMGNSSLGYSCTVRCHLRIYFVLSYSYKDCIYSKSHVTCWIASWSIRATVLEPLASNFCNVCKGFLCSTHKNVRKESLSLILRYFLFKLQFNCQYLVMMPHSIWPTGKRKIWCLSFQNSFEKQLTDGM